MRFGRPYTAHQQRCFRIKVRLTHGTNKCRRLEGTDHFTDGRSCASSSSVAFSGQEPCCLRFPFVDFSFPSILSVKCSFFIEFVSPGKPSALLCRDPAHRLPLLPAELGYQRWLHLVLSDAGLIKIRLHLSRLFG
jgi:hypothetical protein